MKMELASLILFLMIFVSEYAFSNIRGWSQDAGKQLAMMVRVFEAFLLSTRFFRTRGALGSSQSGPAYRPTASRGGPAYRPTASSQRRPSCFASAGPSLALRLARPPAERPAPSDGARRRGCLRPGAAPWRP